MNNQSGKYIALTFLTALAVIAMMAAFTALSPTLQRTAQAQPELPTVAPTNTPKPPTRTPRPTDVPVCEFLIGLDSSNVGRSANNAMQFTTAQGSSIANGSTGMVKAFHAVNLYGDAPCNWSAKPDYDWITLAISGGRLGAGEIQEDIRIEIHDNASRLRPGKYSNVIRFQVQEGEIKVSNSLYVELTVLAPCDFSVAEDYLIFELQQGADFSAVEEKVIPIANRAGAGDCEWKANPERHWLSVNPRSGTLTGGGHGQVTVRIDESVKDLLPGSWESDRFCCKM